MKRDINNKITSNNINNDYLLRLSCTKLPPWVIVLLDNLDNKIDNLSMNMERLDDKLHQIQDVLGTEYTDTDSYG